MAAAPDGHDAAPDGHDAAPDGPDGARLADPICVVCGGPLGERPLRVRYELRAYTFDRAACKLTFQENPDRWLDAGGEVLPEPR